MLVTAVMTGAFLNVYYMIDRYKWSDNSCCLSSPTLKVEAAGSSELFVILVEE